MMFDLRLPHWASVLALLSHDPYFWFAFAAGIMGVALAFHYIRCADRLTALVNQRFPELWEKLWPRGRFAFLYGLNGASRLENLILFDSGQTSHPDSSDFRRLVVAARWATVALLLDLLAFTIFLAKIKPVF